METKRTFVGKRLRVSLAFFGCLLALISFMTNSAIAQTALFSAPYIADVTDRSFSVIWTSSEPVDEQITAYQDAAGTQIDPSALISNAIKLTGSTALLDPMQSASNLTTAISQRGIVRATVAGLSAETTYYVRYGGVSNTTTATTTCPDAGVLFCDNAQLLTVTTTKVPDRINLGAQFTNDVISLDVPNGLAGELVLLSVEGSAYPVSAFIGDGAVAPTALVDLNNVYNLSSAQIAPVQGASLSSYGNQGDIAFVRHYQGLAGASGTSISTYFSDFEGAKYTGEFLTGQELPIGDCNADGSLNSYDSLLLSGIVEQTLPESTFKANVFHPWVCDLKIATPAFSPSLPSVIDTDDDVLHRLLMIKAVDAALLPEVL